MGGRSHEDSLPELAGGRVRARAAARKDARDGRELAVGLRWDCGGIAVGLRWDCGGIAAGLRRDCDGIAAGLRWDCGGIAVGSRRDRGGIAMTLRWARGWLPAARERECSTPSAAHQVQRTKCSAALTTPATPPWSPAGAKLRRDWEVAFRSLD